jgi:hypothetical protein
MGTIMPDRPTRSHRVRFIRAQATFASSAHDAVREHAERRGELRDPQSPEGPGHASVAVRSTTARHNTKGTMAFRDAG